MKIDHLLNSLRAASAITVFGFVVLLPGELRAEESVPPQAAIPGTYQAVSVGQDKSGDHHIILIVNTATGKVEQSIAYEDATDKQEIVNFVKKEVSVITPRKEETRKIVR